MTWKFSKRSKDKMRGVHPALVQVMEAALPTSPFDFGVTSGLRTHAEQVELVARGSSKTMKSKHLEGLAIDIAVYNHGQLTWEMKYYEAVAAHIKHIAANLGIGITWGGDWKSFRDGPHYQLKEMSK